MSETDCENYLLTIINWKSRRAKGFVKLLTSGRSPRGRRCPRNRDAPLEPDSYPKLEAPYRLHLPVVRAVEMRLRCPDMGMAPQCLNCPEILDLQAANLGHS
jgi:hypothetical protein